MSAKNHKIVSVLLSLLLVISAPAFALSDMTGGQTVSSMADCGSMMKDQAGNPASPSGNETNCVSGTDMTCPHSAGLSKCGTSISFALLPGDSIDFTDTGIQPVLTARMGLYQDPFLATITPPPDHHS
jgi:hypothetical protein